MIETGFSTVILEPSLREQLNPKRFERGIIRLDFDGKLTRSYFDEVESVIIENGYIINAVLPTYNPDVERSSVRFHVFLNKETQT